jgi:ABC-type sugar transport system ATPase subunit
VTENSNPTRTKKLPARIKGDVVYENVHFGYAADRPVLRNINLHARPGEMIALVGPTGAGKSTIVNLLAAFYDPTGGAIIVDGNDISRATLDSLRAQISVVSQEPFLFNGTVRENILYGKLDAAEKDGSRAKPEFGSVWYHSMGDPANPRSHMTIAVPGATTKTLGLPENGQQGGVWIMNAGTSTAHIMIPGR